MPCYLSVLFVFLFFSKATIETVRESLDNLISAVGPKNFVQLYLKAKARSEFKHCFFPVEHLTAVYFDFYSSVTWMRILIWASDNLQPSVRYFNNCICSRLHLLHITLSRISSP